MDAGILSAFLANSRDGLLHVDEPTIGIFVRIRGQSTVSVFSEHVLADMRLDAVAADDGIGLCRGAVLKFHPQSAVGLLGEGAQPLPELNDVVWYKANHLFEKVRAMHAVLAQTVGEGEGVVVAVAVAVNKVEPDILLRLPGVAGAHALKGFVDTVVAHLHGLHGIGAEGDPSSDLAKCGRLLIHLDWDFPAAEGNGESDSGYATANDGQLELVRLCHLAWLTGSCRRK